MGNRYPRKSLMRDDCYGCPYVPKGKCNRKDYCLRHIKGFAKRYYKRWFRRYLKEVD